MSEVLLGTKEAVLLSGIPENFPPCRVDDILQIEIQERRDCLGAGLYDSMLADLADYSGEPEFVSGSTYNPGDVVRYNGMYFEAEAVTTDLPTNTATWKLAPKFQLDLYNQLWVFLGRYLACLAIKASIEPNAVKMTGAGLVKMKGDDFEPASGQDVNRLYTWLNARIEQSFRNMHYWLVDRSSESALSGYAGLSTCTPACESYIPDYPSTVCCQSCGGSGCSDCLDAKASYGNTYNVG